ncbi:glycosyltransferase family 4 protein [Pedobacter glucosidilyticus]|uniref:glycosyltransferase family 4 protein n=1 Tax=Pedobacter glucosidilyticus TaxID=1122941 RepID=UPI0026EA12C7|nr:glycosyltransferase family 1 protein [Pedobacter glucosidilyticus]
MKIFLDDLIFNLQVQGGISVYWRAFIKQISQYNNVDVTIIKNKSERVASLITHPKYIADRFRSIFLSRILPLCIKLPKRSIFHSSYLRTSLQRKSVANIVTIHDLAAEERVLSGKRRIFKLILQKFAINNADGLICVSYATKKSILKHYPSFNKDNIEVIYHGCSSSYYNTIESSREKVILYVGSRGLYKNFEICLEVLSKLQDYRLIIVGGEILMATEKLKLDLALANRYEYHYNISEQKLNEFYNKSHCLLYPSLFEGFGMPIVEAMKAGCPVVASDIDAIKEITQGACILIKDLKNHVEYIKSIKQLEDTELRNSYINKGLLRAQFFTWETNYESTIKFYKKIYVHKFGFTPPTAQ